MGGKGYIVAVLCLPILVGCAGLADHSQTLSVGMTTDQAQEVLGDNVRPKNRVLNQQGQLQELWEYSDANDKPKMWLCFTDYKLARWAIQGQTLNGVPINLPSDLIEPVKGF